MSASAGAVAVAEEQDTRRHLSCRPQPGGWVQISPAQGWGAGNRTCAGSLDVCSFLRPAGLTSSVLVQGHSLERNPIALSERGPQNTDRELQHGFRKIVRGVIR